MSCDISALFDTIVSTIKSNTTINSNNLKLKNSSCSNEFSFTRRAKSLNHNLQVLSSYLKRIHQLTSCTFGNKHKQRLHSELTEQVTVLIEQCDVLLGQLKELIYVDDRINKSKVSNEDECQLFTHHSSIHKILTDELIDLKKRRDLEINRQEHLLELSGNLATAVRSISSSGFQTSKYLDIKEHPNSESLFSNSTSKPDSEVQVRNRKSNSHFVPSNTQNSEHDLNVDETELRTLEMENESLFGHLSHERDEVHQVARAISEIGRLNQTISEHLVQQLETTEQISNYSVAATENVKQGNELLREAMNRKATLQFWILFTLILLTFSLHFLDWYNP